ncbi:MAG: DUF3307 domain-containing protein [Elusimicrobia bacterium]|nr:DUF3307 domain-containing protein [Elusimicrobiota bacterium]
MTVFWRLLFGHFLADFTLQTNFINSWKRQSFWGMLLHTGTHPICYLLLTYPYLDRFWVQTDYFSLRGWTCILLLFLFHLLEDEWRIYTIRRFRTSDSTLYFLWDQVIHLSVIFLLFPLGMYDREAALIPEAWPIIGVLLILATHFATVLIYFIEKDWFGAHYPQVDEKYLLILERLALTCCFLLPGSWWVALVSFWLGHMFYLRYRRVHDFSWFSVGFGGLIAVACGIFARLVYYNGSNFF